MYFFLKFRDFHTFALRDFIVELCESQIQKSEKKSSNKSSIYLKPRRYFCKQNLPAILNFTKIVFKIFANKKKKIRESIVESLEHF